MPRLGSQIEAWLHEEDDMIRRLTATGIVLAGLLAAAWVPAQATGAARAATAAAGSTADCDSVTTCYTPEQLQVAYGVKPLLNRGIDGRGETVVLPELAESTLDPPLVSDMRQDMERFDSLFHLPAARMRVVSSFPGSVSPWLAFGEEVLDVEMVHALAPAANLVILLVKRHHL
jgi:subtilase family serine protease